jgi:hypothetical protein
MTRETFIERALRQIYGGYPPDDSTITPNLVNTWLSDAIGVAAKSNYKDNIAIDGIGFVNNSFYTKFRGLTISSDGNFIWKITLPEVPLGIGLNEGISTLELKDSSGNITRPFIPLSENQKTYYQGMQPIPNKVLYYYEGELLYVVSTLLLNQYTVNVTMVSGGDSTDLDSTLNVPADYYPVMVEYIKQQLLFERNIPVDDKNDGVDALKTV